MSESNSESRFLRNRLPVASETVRERRRGLNSGVSPAEGNSSADSGEPRGIGRVALLFLATIIGAVVYAGYQIFPFYYYYYELLGLMEAQTRKASLFTDAEIRKNVWEKIQELEIPIETADEIRINRLDTKIVIELEYTEVFTLAWKNKEYDLWEFDFHPRAERKVGK